MSAIQAYEEYQGAMCVLMKAVVPAVLSENIWNNTRIRKSKDKFVYRVGGNGRKAAMDLRAFPDNYREKIISKFGEPKKVHNALWKHFEIDTQARIFYEGYELPNGDKLKPSEAEQCTLTASTIKALFLRQQELLTLRKRSGNKRGNIFDILLSESEAFKRDLKNRYGIEHTLPSSVKRLQLNLNAFKSEDYVSVIDKRKRNQNNSKVVSGEQYALLEKLLSAHQNLNNEQIRNLYNTIASAQQWKTISAGTVANIREDLALYVAIGNSGITNFRNTKSMQNKRRSPKFPLYFWTIDGWDVELLYQRTDKNKKGHYVTTYHNRLNCVMLLDKFNEYIIGYAIGEKETPTLIRAAILNALNHTIDLFGERYMTQQVQSDNYGRGALNSIYQAVSKYYTPAKVGNAKAKPIEPFFKKFNEKHLSLLPNWSGHGVKSKHQPNGEHLNAIRHSFPNQHGCMQQIIEAIESDRAEKREAFISQFHQMPEEHKLPLPLETYLHLFGQTTGFTNRLEPSGFNPTINGEKRSYDTFDIRFREQRQTDWIVKYDPEDLSRVLVVNAERKGNEIIELATQRFILEEKYIQPMALVERKEGDAEKLQKVFDFNKQLEQQVAARAEIVKQTVQEVVLRTPELNDTLAKFMLTDSNGQHKDQKNANRALTQQQPKSLPTNNPESYEIIEEDIRKFY